MKAATFTIGNEALTLYEILQRRRTNKSVKTVGRVREYNYKSKCPDCGKIITNGSKRCTNCYITNRYK